MVLLLFYRSCKVHSWGLNQTVMTMILIQVAFSSAFLHFEQTNQKGATTAWVMERGSRTTPCQRRFVTPNAYEAGKVQG